MKKRFLTFLAAALLPAAAFAGKIFEVDFDDYGVAPGIAKGDKRVYKFKDADLQLRMFPGVNGKGNSINLANSECVEYLMPGNFNPKCGTVSLWVSPVNWKLSDPEWQVFFFAWQKDFQLRIHKLAPHYIKATIVHRPAGGKQQAITVQARCNTADWSPGRWHKIDVTWDEENIRLYIDGKVPEKTPITVGKSGRVGPTRPAGTFKTRQNLPDASGRFCIGTRSDWQKRKEVNRAHKTAIDSLTIHDRILSAAEIQKEYETIVPPQRRKMVLNYAEIPMQKGSAPDWSKALKLPIATQLKPVELLRADVLAAHNGETLFLKYIVYNKAEKTTITRRDGNVWEDDSIEFHLSSRDGKQQNQYIANSRGVYFDSRNLDPRWNGNAKVAGEQKKDCWTVEMAIPLEDLGGKSIIGKEMSADFCVSIQKGRQQNYYHWCNSTGTVYRARDTIKLSADDSFYQLDLDPVQFAAGNMNLTGKGDLKNETVTAKVVPEGYSEVRYPENFNGATWKRRLNGGKHNLTVKSPRFIYHYDFIVDYPLEASVGCNPDTGMLTLDIDLTNAGEAAHDALRGKTIPGKVKLLDPSGKTVAESTFSMSAIKGTATVSLPKDPVAGTYKVEVSTSGKNTTFTRQVPFRVPDMTPFKLRIGNDHTVPEPWQPLRDLQNNRYQTLTGTVQIGPGAFPSRLTNKGVELLTSAPVWTLNGESVKWENLKRGDVFDDYVVYTGTGKAGKLHIDWRGELWFDGAWILKFKLSPLSGNAAVNDFNIAYQVAPAAGKFAMDPIYLPFKDGKVAVALGGDARRKDNILWISGHEKGVFFWTKSNANWANKPGEKPLTAQKDAAGTSVRLNVISRPVTLSSPAEYTMVFMGTPSRVPMDGFRLVNYGSMRNSNVTYHSINWSGFYNTANANDMTTLTSCAPAYPDKLRQTFTEKMARNVKTHIYTMPGQISNLEPVYDFIGKNNWSTPRLNHSGTKLGQPWLLDYFCFNATDRTADWWCYNLDNTLRTFPNMIHGPYFDVASTKFCENQIHGCGGKDVFGQDYISSDALGLRTFMMRVYKTVHKYKGSIMLHSHVQFLPMSHGFVDAFSPGENTFHILIKNLDYGYCEDIPLEQYQVDFNWRKAGVPYCHIIQSGRICRNVPAFKKLKNKVENSPEYALRALTPPILHDFNTWSTFVYNPTINHWWGLRKQLGLGGDAEFVGYWENQAVKPSASNTYCSYYIVRTPGAPFRRLLLFGNFNRTPVKAACTIDFKALGIEKTAVVTEIWRNKTKKGGRNWTNREIPLAEINNITIPGNHFAIIGIK